jgi:serine/threonine-protein kinase
MDLERWRRIESIYHSALERPPDPRRAFLAEACQGDGELRRQVEVLLSQSESTDDLVGRPVWEVVASATETSSVLTPGARF